MRQPSAAEDFAVLFDAFEAFALLEDRTEVFADFLDRFAELESQQRAAPELFLPKAREFLEEFDALWRAHLEENAEHPPSLNIWQLAELGRDEVRNCRVLTWFLDPIESHAQGPRFFFCLMDAIGRPAAEGDRPLRVHREVTTAAGDSRMDILIELPAEVICMEAKIQAEEDFEQLRRYGERLRERYPRKEIVGKLLTLDGSRGEQIAAGFTRMLWSDVAAALGRFAGLGDAADPCAAKSLFIRQLAAQYADFIRFHFRRDR